MKGLLRGLLALVLVALTISVGSGTRAQQPTAISPNAQAALVLRVLGYDRGLRARTPSGNVNVLTVFKTGDSASQGSCMALARAINQLGRAVLVGGMRTHATPVGFTTADALGQAAQGAQAIYVCGGLDASIAAISSTARRRALLSITAREADVRSGLSVAIVPGAQLRIVVNVTAATAEGARLDAALLRIATVVR